MSKYIGVWKRYATQEGKPIHISVSCYTDRLVTLIIGSCEPIQATVGSQLLSLRVRPGYGLGVGAITT